MATAAARDLGDLSRREPADVVQVEQAAPKVPSLPVLEVDRVVEIRSAARKDERGQKPAIAHAMHIIPLSFRTFVLLAVVHTAAIPALTRAAVPRAAPVSALVVDARTGLDLYASNAGRVRPPASLAKIMTLLLVFDALDSGELHPSDKVVMTARAARQQPSRLGLAPGETIAVSAAMRTVAVISANDVTVALAEHLAGTESKFVQRMNARAVQIGMPHTRFGNATGLAPSAGLTTARDMAVLARYVIRHHPTRYKLFETRSIRWNDRVRPNHNLLLGKVYGLDGMKTGYTVQAGFNLVASAKRAGKRIIVVVMGSPTGGARDVQVSNLLELGFTAASASSDVTKRRG